MCEECKTCCIGMHGDVDIAVLSKCDYFYCDFKECHELYNHECEDFLKYNNTDIVVLEDNLLYLVSLSAKRMKNFMIQNLSIDHNDIFLTMVKKNDKSIKEILSLNNLFKVVSDGSEPILKHLNLL